MRNRLVRIQRLGIVIFLVLASLYLLYYHLLPALWQVLRTVVPWVLPFVAGWFLAALLDPAVDWLEHRARWPRTLASAVLVLLATIVLSLFLAVLVAKMVTELAHLAVELPRYGALLKEGILQLDALYKQLPPQVLEATQGSIETLMGYLRGLLTRVVQDLVGVAAGIPRGFIALIVALVASFFFSRDRDLIRKGTLSLFPWLYRPQVADVLREVGAGVIGYFKAQGLLIGFTALQVLAGLYLLKVKYAVTLSLFIALLDILPVVGPGTVFLPWAGWELVNRHYGLGLALIALYATITVVRQILEPKVVGRNLGLHPLAALASIFIGIQALGLVGAVLGPLLLVFLKAAYRAGLLRRQQP